VVITDGDTVTVVIGEGANRNSKLNGDTRGGLEKFTTSGFMGVTVRFNVVSLPKKPTVFDELTDINKLMLKQSDASLHKVTEPLLKALTVEKSLTYALPSSSLANLMLI
jgi:hypothetical protein